MKLKKFFIELYKEEKIPNKDKKIIIFLFVIAVIPPLFSQEWASSLYGFITSFIIFSFIPDYFFNILDQNLVLSHYPYGLKSYSEIKKFGQFVSILAPTFISDFLWEYKKDIY